MILVIDWGVGRIDIFLIYALCALVEHTTTKRHYITAYTYPREHGTTRESVNQFSLVILIAQACLLKETNIVALLLRLTRHGISVGRRETKSELIYYIIPETTLTEILHSHGTAINIIMKDVGVIVRSPVIGNEHPLSLRLLLTLLIRKLFLLNLNAIAIGKPTESLRICELFVLHQEANGIATFTTGKAMAGATGRRHIERRCPIVMERTQSLVV